MPKPTKAGRKKYTKQAPAMYAARGIPHAVMGSKPSIAKGKGRVGVVRHGWLSQSTTEAVRTAIVQPEPPRALLQHPADAHRPVPPADRGGVALALEVALVGFAVLEVVDAVFPAEALVPVLRPGERESRVRADLHAKLRGEERDVQPGAAESGRKEFRTDRGA